MSRKVIPPAVAIAIALFVAACAKQNVEPRNGTAQIAKPQDSAVRAYIDPNTGEAREPTRAELESEAASNVGRKKPLSRNVESEEVVTPSGAVELTLDQSGDTSLKGCVAANGDIKMEHDCPAPAKKNEKK